MRDQIVLMQVKPDTYLDIKKRLEALGPIYTRDFFLTHPKHGLVLVFGEVGFVPEGPLGREPEVHDWMYDRQVHDAERDR